MFHSNNSKTIIRLEDCFLLEAEDSKTYFKVMYIYPNNNYAVRFIKVTKGKYSNTYTSGFDGYYTGMLGVPIRKKEYTDAFKDAISYIRNYA